MDHFEHDTADETWIAVVAAKGWVAITHIERIRYTPNEKAAVMRARLGLIVLVGKVRHAQHAENFVRGIAKIEAFVAAQERPFIAKLYRATPAELARNTDATGRIERWV